MVLKSTLEQIKNEDEMVYYLIVSYEKLLKEKKIRELGKILAESNEFIQRDWINENTSFTIKKRDDNDLNSVGYDLITLDGLMTVQGKLRSKDLHLEQTRRISEKNKKSSKTGHVAYSVGESNLYMFSKPNIEDYGNIKKWEFIVIPEFELIDKKNPNFLITRVPKKIWEKYVGRSKEILETEYFKIVNEYEKTLVNS